MEARAPGACAQRAVARACLGQVLAVDTTAPAAFADTHAIRRERSVLVVELRVKPADAFRPTPAFLLLPLEGRVHPIEPYAMASNGWNGAGRAVPDARA
jgi:hypothetical protein